ncbi:UNC93-like protein [Araneus ventricosus]|uniref:UNC93-like protein n=1 Tax=Araneus ventricosus TaxID=182803 RepID=A0A4Y2AAT0_ARAVE|nr:UNC93-like protein [Araneus ventricosus]
MDQVNPSEQRIPKLTKLHMIKNLTLISLSFFLLFTAYDGLSMLQSTMNKEAGIGVISQAVGFISFCISALLLPKYVIKRLGCKSSLFVSIILYIPFIAANFYPKWYIMIPTGVLAGMGASVLWGSQCTYFNESAVRYARLITDGAVKLSQAPDIHSNRTSVDIVSERDFHFESIEEISLKDEPAEIRNSEDNLLKYKCKNPGCGNVDEFVVSEIAKNCVQYLKNTVENSDLSQTKGQSTSRNLCPDEYSPGTVHEQSLIQKRTDDSKTVEKDDNGWPNKNKISNLDEGAVPPNSNQECQPIFQRTLESVTGLFFGFHGIAYYSAQICSNVISYYVLKEDEDAPALSYFIGCSCGAQFCNDNPWCINDDTEYVSRSIRYLLTTVCVVIASISALLIFFCVDPLKKVKSEDETEKISLSLVFATINHTKKKEQLCLIPLSFYEGMLQGFYTADFTKSYIGCAWGASKVGLVSIFYGAACVISSSASGFFVKYIGRKPLFLIGQVINILMAIFLMLWKPESNSPYKFYIASIFFGTITGILWSQLLAFYGLLFKKDEEAAFASYYLWSSLGWTTSFLYSDHLCTYVKIYLLLTVSLTGTTGYFFTERSYELRKKQRNAALT